MSEASIPLRIKAIINGLKGMHRDILEGFESNRPARQLEAAQHQAVKLCRKLMRSYSYEKQLENTLRRIIRLRTDNLELFCFEINKLSFMAIMKDGVMVGAFTHSQSTPNMHAHAYNENLSSAFSAADLRAFIDHPKPASLVMPCVDYLPPLTSNLFGLSNFVGRVIYPDIFEKADIATSEVHKAFPHFRREKLADDLGL